MKRNHQIIWIAAFCLLTCSRLIAEDSSSAVLEVRGKGKVDSFQPGVKLFTDRPYVLKECPDLLKGQKFLRNSIDQTEDWTVTQPGVLTVLTPVVIPTSASQAEALVEAGFQKVENQEPFQLFGPNAIDRVEIYQKPVRVGEHYRFGKYVVAIGFADAVLPESKPWSKNTGELLYNGIRLPQTWPPQDIETSDMSPMPVPYLEHPPAVILIDVGRQLFMDDFLVESTDLEREFHMPKKYEGNPVLKPETDLELNKIRTVSSIERGNPGNAAAVPKSGGCWWDPDENLFKMWYEAGWINTICLATSRDGIHWDRLESGIHPGSNQVLPDDLTPDSWTVVRNWDSDDPEEKWALFVQPPLPAHAGVSLTSADGVHWDRREATGPAGDRSTLFYNPFRKKWVYSLRTDYSGRGRSRAYYECDNFMKNAQWADGDEVPWVMSDDQDPPDPYIGTIPQLYNVDAVAYESILLGLFEIHRGPTNEICSERGVPKITELNFAYSRDGFHWDRPDRRIHIPAERKDVWDRGYVQSLGNICVIMGDSLYLYYSAFQGDEEKTGGSWLQNGMYARGATGLAILRRDGFASMNAAEQPGTLTTRPVTFSGKYLFVNVDAPDGLLRAAVVDQDGNEIEPFTLSNCEPISTDSTLEPVRWKNGSDLSSLAGEPVRFRFELSNGALYSFWVSKDNSGRSDGYVAGGGPGYVGPTDTVGEKALEASQ